MSSLKLSKLGNEVNCYMAKKVLSGLLIECICPLSKEYAFSCVHSDTFSF